MDVPEPTRTSLESFVPKRIRTSGLWIRNPMLYPAELWALVRRAFRASLRSARLDIHVFGEGGIRTLGTL